MDSPLISHQISCALLRLPGSGAGWVGMLLLTGCLGKTDLLVLPPPPPASLELRFLAEDAATAESLGWSQGVPDVEVTLTPADTTQAPLHLRSNPDGTLNAEDIPGGRYSLYAVRWLNEAERDRLARGDDAVGFLTKTVLVTGSSSGPIHLTSSRRRGVVISEIKPEALFLTGIGSYFYSWYLRLYNNGDTTAYLDGMIIGSGRAWQFDYPTFGCDANRPFSEDPAGIWSAWFSQLPGSGSQYPLAPGETAVMAMDAIDHRPLFPEGLDLRGADFEFFGGAGDVDNPAVPNIPDVGLPVPLGHGLAFNNLANVVILARPLDVAALVRKPITADAAQWARIPADKIVDVVSTRSMYRAQYPECDRIISPAFDRESVQLIGNTQGDDSLAYRRLATPLTLDGRAVLQDTRWSALDFKVSQRSPFARP